MSFCPGGSIELNGKIYTEEGTVVDTLAAANGCDSIVTTLLAFSASTVYNESATICSGDSILLGNNFYSQPGTFTDTLTASGGCDSIVVLTLSLLPPATSNQQMSFCQGGSVEINGQVYAEEATVVDTLAASSGCDSIVTTLLTFTNSAIYEETTAICAGDSVFVWWKLLLAAGHLFGHFDSIERL